ncbi:hypothetical protein FGO68_gene4878 [Halteria grandinella]|uniref:Mre11 DNA-binding domain-containing protein n=1 Tax=Halteria grandinella TaxID=5974 RepID=A0A8J8NXW4_HALGN|nr:hypothetical protein FGO68_gene4878 [Halteria grandinella]
MGSNNYVNYFGKVTNIEDIEVVPILFQKGNTKVALYGIGNMKDERLNIAFENKKIKFKRPVKYRDEWFNILVLHQNKYKGMHIGTSRRNSLTEGMIPKFFHLVIWAHEHESIPVANECQENGVHFLQPGSTVATQLHASEAKDKHFFLLQVVKQQFKCQPIRMHNVRPFVFDQIELSKITHPQPLDPRNNHQLEDFLIHRISKLLDTVDTTSKLPELKLPLLRLRIEHSGYPVVKSKRLVDHFNDKIANITDFMQFYKKSGIQVQNAAQGGGSRDQKETDSSSLIIGSGMVGMDEIENQNLLQKIYKAKMNEYCTLNFIPTSRMASTIEKYVNKDEPRGLETFFDHEVFKAAYQDIKKNMLDVSLNSLQRKSYREISEDLEKNMRSHVQTFLKGVFLGDDEDDEDLVMGDMGMESFIEEQKHSYQNLKQQKYTKVQNRPTAGMTTQFKVTQSEAAQQMFQEGPYSKQLGQNSMLRQMLTKDNDNKRNAYMSEHQEFESIFSGLPEQKQLIPQKRPHSDEDQDMEEEEDQSSETSEKRMRLQ